MNGHLVTEEYLIGGTPVLACFNQAECQPRPLVILSHGFQGSKDDLRDKAAILASMGYYAVAIDNRGHGDRGGPDFASQVFCDGKLDVHQVRRLIKETADDIPAIVDHFEKDERVEGQRIAMLGISMGGFVTFRALVVEKRISVAVTIIASPYWDEVPADVPVLAAAEAKEALAAYAREYAPAHHAEQFFPRPLLVQIAGKDNHYNVQRVEPFCRELQKLYGDQANRVKLIVHQDVAHEFTTEMWTNGVEWLQTHL